MNLGELLYFLRNMTTDSTTREINIKTKGHGRVSDMMVTSVTQVDYGLEIECCTAEDDRPGSDFILDYINATDEEREAARACVQPHVSL